MSNPKFKVGDIVRCCKKKYEVTDVITDKIGGAGWEEGLEFEILSITTSNFYTIYWKGKDGNGVFENWLELVSRKSRREKEAELWGIKQ